MNLDANLVIDKLNRKLVEIMSNNVLLETQVEVLMKEIEELKDKMVILEAEKETKLSTNNTSKRIENQ